MDQSQAAALVAAGATASNDHGRPCLNLPSFYPFAFDLVAGALRLDLQQAVDTDADFYLRGWKWIDTGAAYLMLARWRLLNGYYLSNVLMPMVHLNLRAVTPELRIPAGGFIGIEGNNTDVVTRKLKFIFFGVKRYYLDQGVTA
jgi:hypothetical protein